MILFSHVTRPKHFVLIVIFIAGVSLLGILLAASLRLIGQSQDIRQQASEIASVPTPTPHPHQEENPYLWITSRVFDDPNNGKVILGQIQLNTWGNYIDGMQAIIYITESEESKNNGPFAGQAHTLANYFDFFQPNIDLSPYLNELITVQTNSVIYEPEHDRYKIALAFISSNPNTPLNTNEIPIWLNPNGYAPLIVGNVLFKPKADLIGELLLPVTFDYQVTKVIEHNSGADLMDRQQNFVPAEGIEINYIYYINYRTPTPTTTPSATPTATPTQSLPTATPTAASPTATPTEAPPTPTPTIAQMSVINVYFRPEEYINPTYPYNPISEYQAVLWDTQNNQQILLSNQEIVAGAPGVLIYKASYEIAENTSAKLYLKLRKHHSFAIDLTLPKTHVIPTAVSLTTDLVKAGEITGDNTIDLEDYHQLAKRFNPGVIAEVVSPISDLNHDGMTDISDYAILANNFDIEYQSPLFPN